MSELPRPTTKPYWTWQNMKRRVNSKNGKDYHRYGGRGIFYDKKWESFEGFWSDMGAGYKEGLSLDRINNNGNYEKSNCRWATPVEQARNTRNIETARRYTYKGQTKTVCEWAEAIGIKRTTLHMRLQHYKWPIDKALEVSHR